MLRAADKPRRHAPICALNDPVMGECDCGANAPDYPAMARAVLARLGGGTWGTNIPNRASAANECTRRLGTPDPYEVFWQNVAREALAFAREQLPTLEEIVGLLTTVMPKEKGAFANALLRDLKARLGGATERDRDNKGDRQWLSRR